MTDMADGECLFCRVVAGEVPATVVGESEAALAFRDIDPQAPTHVLVIPRTHVTDVAALAGAPDALAEVVRLAARVAADEGLEGYRVVFNVGRAAGQAVFHAHAHVLGGRSLRWPPG